MARPLKVVHVGLGPIGQGIARLVAETDGLQIVGATDPFPDHAGKDLGPLLGLPRRLRVKVESNPERFFRRARADVAILSTSSALKTVKAQVAALVWKLERVEETLEPAIAPRDLDTEYLRIPAGAAAGIKQFARGYRNGDVAISLDLQMYVGAESPRDHVLVAGLPPIDMTIAGGVAGDAATAAIVVNAIPKVLSAPAGVLTMKDLPLVHRYNPAEVKS